MSTPESTPEVPLEWAAFCERYFPARPRHDREAITAYAAYRNDWTPALNAAPVTGAV